MVLRCYKSQNLACS